MRRRARRREAPWVGQVSGSSAGEGGVSTVSGPRRSMNKVLTPSVFSLFFFSSSSRLRMLNLDLPLPPSPSSWTRPSSPAEARLAKQARKAASATSSDPSSRPMTPSGSAGASPVKVSLKKGGAASAAAGGKAPAPGPVSALRGDMEAMGLVDGASGPLAREREEAERRRQAEEQAVPAVSITKAKILEEVKAKEAEQKPVLSLVVVGAFTFLSISLARSLGPSLTLLPPPRRSRRRGQVDAHGAGPARARRDERQGDLQLPAAEREDRQGQLRLRLDVRRLGRGARAVRPSSSLSL